MTLVTNFSELLKAYKRALNYSNLKQVIIEQYIEGREFSIKYLTNKWKHYFITITGKVTTEAPFFIEIEHHQPANISIIEKNKIKEITQKTLFALNIYSGASHTELN